MQSDLYAQMQVWPIFYLESDLLLHVLLRILGHHFQLMLYDLGYYSIVSIHKASNHMQTGRLMKLKSNN